MNQPATGFGTFVQHAKPIYNFVERKSIRAVKAFLRFVRWLFEFALPVYVLTAVICFTLLTIALREYTITIPGVGALSAQSLNLPKPAFPTAVPPYAPGMAPTQAPAAENDPVILRERIEMMKETQERTLTVIAALAAVLTFLGFKGYTTISEAREKVREVETKAETVKNELEEFVVHEYKADMLASLNVMHGIVARDISDVIKKLLSITNPGMDPCLDSDYLRVIDEGMYYVKNVINKADNVSTPVLKRAHGVIGNLQKRKNNWEAALDHVEHITRAVADRDENAWFNIACYSSLLAEKYAKAVPPNLALSKQYVHKAMNSLPRCIALNSDYRLLAQTDVDLAYVRDNHQTEFAKATA